MSGVVGQRAAMVIVEQLSHAQWHAVDAGTNWCSGVTNWVAAVDAALWAAMLTSSGVESIGLDGDRLLLLHSPVSA